MLMHGHQGALPRPEGDPRRYGATDDSGRRTPRLEATL